jgi:phospholipid/cholesterol/gamma-HCH transport system ATP-binding protein
MDTPIVEIKGLKNYLGEHWVHKDVNLSVNRGEIAAIIGGSGSGKTTILRSLLMLLKPTEGDVRLFGENVWAISDDKMQHIRQRLGMLFQKNALFSGLTMLENVMFPLQKYTSLSPDFIESLALLKILMVGLSSSDVHKYPSELSGGMQKRVAAARALALDPELLFLDEPVSGLDPNSAKRFDELLLFLRNQLNLTIVMVSHDVGSLKRITDKVFFIGEGRVIASGSLTEVMAFEHPMIQDYFHL